MNLSNRISKLEKLAAAIPEVNREHIEAVVRFLESGDPGTLPEGGVDRAATLIVARAIPDEDVGAYPGLAKIAEGLSGGAIFPELAARSAAEALAVLKRQDPTGEPCPIVLAEDDKGYQPGRTEPLPAERPLAALGLVRFFRIQHKRPDGIEQNRTDS